MTAHALHPWFTSPCVMGIVNTTPDSFSDGGRYQEAGAVQARLRRLAGDGAAICDIGAESTRPGADAVSPGEQIRRLDAVFSSDDVAPLPLSVDTSSATVAEYALDHGAVMVNDVTAGRGDPGLLDLAADRGCGLCLMHMRGEPRTMQDTPHYEDVVAEVRAFLAERVAAAVRAGVDESAIVVDPGIGFGKRLSDNIALLANIAELRSLGVPVLVGVSRKRMFGDLLGRDVSDRLPASLAAGLRAVAGGADILRVHDVRETVDALRVWTETDGGTR